MIIHQDIKQWHALMGVCIILLQNLMPLHQYVCQVGRHGRLCRSHRLVSVTSPLGTPWAPLGHPFPLGRAVQQD